jgi:predicted phage-related endonuclease
VSARWNLRKSVQPFGATFEENGILIMKRRKHTPKVIEVRDRAHWEEIRSGTVGASESAALFETVANEFDVSAEAEQDGVDYEEEGEPISPYMSPLGLWALKSGRIKAKPTNNNTRIEWGTQLEPVIAEHIAAKSGWTLRKPLGYYVHPRIPRMGASLDFEVEVDGTGRWYPFEIKNVAVDERWKWRNAVGEWVVPGHIQIQAQHQLAVTGLERCYIGVLFGGNEDRVFEIERDDALIKEIEAAVKDFWWHVDNDKAPEANLSRDGWVIKRLYAMVDPQNVIDLSNDADVRELVANMKHHSSQASFHKKEADRLRQELTMRLGSASHAYLGDAIITSTIVEGAQVSYYREPYRKITVSKPKKKHAGLPVTKAVA